MISPIKNIKNVFPINTANTEYIVRNIYPRVEHGYFNESPNIYDKKYISGITRSMAQLKIEEFINEKSRRLNYMKTMYSPCPEDFQPISRDEASIPEGSWLTVISGKRPMGNFLWIVCTILTYMHYVSSQRLVVRSSLKKIVIFCI